MGDSMLMERKQKVEINRRKPKVFAIVCLFFVTFATIFRILCWMTVVLSDYLKTEQLTPC